MKRYIKQITGVFALSSLALLNSCSLDEKNPGGFTFDTVTMTEDGYQAILNQIYFGAERVLYGTDGYMQLTEADTDLWTTKANDGNSNTQYFWFFGGASANTTYTNTIWNAIYDGIGSCNTAIAYAANPPISEAKRNNSIAQARFMRAVYYFNAVEQFGGVVKVTDLGVPNYAPERTDPLTIYKEVIIPDLEFATQYLDKGTDATCTTPTKKAALGFLAKACLQTYEYGSTEFLQKGMDAAKALITDCENGGSQYGAYMYSNFEDVFKQDNSWENKEALWKHRWYSGSDYHGSSNGAQKCNRNDEMFLAAINHFAARQDNPQARQTWEGGQTGSFMPTRHLLNLFVQEDGSLDPRFHKSFVTEWNCNRDYTWTDGDAKTYGKDASVVGKTLKFQENILDKTQNSKAIGDLAIKFVMPQDAGYASEVANAANASYLLVDYKKVYSDADRNVIMTSGNAENHWRYFYPSLSKHNSSNIYVVNESKNRFANLNATFIMRMAEVYLIAAELDIYLNGGSGAMAYINKVRTRAGANALSGTASVRTVLDERGRELCGEYSRFYDLKRTGMFKDANYLQETHPDLAKFFTPEYALRPISTTYLATITNGAGWQNPGY